MDTHSLGTRSRVALNEAGVVRSLGSPPAIAVSEHFRLSTSSIKTLDLADIKQPEQAFEGRERFADASPSNSTPSGQLMGFMLCKARWQAALRLPKVVSSSGCVSATLWTKRRFLENSWSPTHRDRPLAPARADRLHGQTSTTRPGSSASER